MVAWYGALADYAFDPPATGQRFRQWCAKAAPDVSATSIGCKLPRENEDHRGCPRDGGTPEREHPSPNCYTPTKDGQVTCGVSQLNKGTGPTR